MNSLHFLNKDFIVDRLRQRVSVVAKNRTVIIYYYLSAWTWVQCRRQELQPKPRFHKKVIDTYLQKIFMYLCNMQYIV